MSLRELAAELQSLDQTPATAAPVEPATDSTASIYREYQDNTIRAAALQTAILKGLDAGESPYKLLFMAAECIGRMTGETRVFADTVKAKITEIHGEALQRPQAATVELADVRARLAMLERPELEQTRALTAAIRAHKARERELLAIIQAPQKNDRTGRPTSDFKGKGNIKPYLDPKSPQRAAQGLIGQGHNIRP